MTAEPETSDALPLVAIYADESCLGNGREGDNPGRPRQRLVGQEEEHRRPKRPEEVTRRQTATGGHARGSALYECLMWGLY